MGHNFYRMLPLHLNYIANANTTLLLSRLRCTKQHIYYAKIQDQQNFIKTKKWIKSHKDFVD